MSADPFDRPRTPVSVDDVPTFAELVDHLVTEHGTDREWCYEAHPNVHRRRALLDDRHRTQHADGWVHLSDQRLADLRAYLGVPDA